MASPTEAGTFVSAEAKHLSQKEWIAPGQSVEGGGVATTAVRQLLHRRFRQRVDTHPMHRRGRGQITQDQAQRMVGPDLIVPVGHDDEDRQITNAPPKEAEQLERGAVGPVGVFGDDDRWPRSRGEGRQHLAEQPVPRVAVEGGLLDAQTKGWGQIPYRTERTRRGQGITGGLEDLRGGVNLAAERLDQGGLAHPGLPAHEYQAPLAGGGVTQMLTQVIEGLLALE